MKEKKIATPMLEKKICGSSTEFYVKRKAKRIKEKEMINRGGRV